MMAHFYEVKQPDGTKDCFIFPTKMEKGPTFAGMTILRMVSEEEYNDSQLKKLVNAAVNASKKKG